MKGRTILAALLACVAFGSPVARADEGGVSFWLPGNFGSFVATPGDPGWTLPIFYYYTSADAGADKTFPRAGRLTAGVDASGSFVFVAPTYTLTTPVAGGQASWGLAAAFGHLSADVDATFIGSPGNVVSGSESDARTGVSDLYPTASLKWNHGAHNSMAYMMAGVPVGTYDVGRLANLGTNHGAIDGGGGYTYLDPKKGRELSAAFGFTYNFENPDTQYRNGFSSHLDWAASQFFSETLHVGIVGYVYYQLTGDSGSGAKLGDFKSQVAGIGPQAGRFFEVSGRKWYANLKAYWEFSAKNRPEGWNAWLTLAIPLTSTR